MNKLKVGVVTGKEKKEILKLYERKNALEELLLSLSKPYAEEKDSAIYDRATEDLKHTDYLYNQWWQGKSRAYSWESVEGKHWTIDFTTNEVFIEL